MIFYDGIIFSLQRSGGISVLYKQIFDRMLSRPEIKYSVLMYKNLSGGEIGNAVSVKPRLLERYRGVEGLDKAGVFHSTYYRVPAVFRNDLKVVTTVHDYTYERFFRGGRKELHSWQKNRSIKFSDKIICVSQSTRRDLLEFSRGVSEDRVEVVYNGVSCEYYPLLDLKKEAQVLFVGARGGYKNFEAVVRALSAFAGLSLVCVGGGGFSSAERSLLERCVPGRYRHAGFLSDAQLNKEYNKSLCLVYPSLYEGFGIPVLEAMRAGCSVVAVNSSSIPEVAGSAALLMERGEVEEIREAIEYLMIDANRELLIEKGFEQSKKFDWDKTFKETLSIYEELLAKKISIDKGVE